MSKRLPMRACARFVQASMPSGRQTLTVTSARLRRSSSVRRADALRLTCTWPSRARASPRSTPSTYWETLARLSATAWSETARVRIELSRMPPAARIAALASRKTRSSVTERSVAARRFEPVPVRSRNVLGSGIGSAAPRLESPDTRLQTVDLDLVFLGTSGSCRRRSAPPRRCSCGAAASGCCSTAARARSGSCCARPSASSSCARSSSTHFHADHYLGLPGMLKTFALRGRELPLTIYGPPGLKELFAALRRIFGKLTYPLELVELRPGDVLERGDYNLVTFPVAHGGAVARLRARRGPAAGPLRRRRGGRARRAQRAGARAAAGRRVDHAARTAASSTPDEVLGPPRPGRRVVITGDTGAVGDGARGRARGRRARPRGDVLRRGARARAGDRGTRPRSRRRELAREAEVGLLALTHLSNRYFGPEIAREARDDLPRDGRAEGLRHDRRAVPRAGRAASRQGRARCTQREADAAPSRVAAMAVVDDALVQVALAEDVAEAEEIQAILAQRGIESSSRPRSTTTRARSRTRRRRCSSPRRRSRPRRTRSRR